MDLPLTGSEEQDEQVHIKDKQGYNELVYIEIKNKLSLTIKGSAAHPINNGIGVTNEKSQLKIACVENFDIYLNGKEQDHSNGDHNIDNPAKYSTSPLFYEQQNYEIVIELAHDNSSEISFWHENQNILNKITPVGRNKKILSGVINFDNNIGYSDLVICINKEVYLKVTIEVFPTKIDYKDDYEAIIQDVAGEMYSLVFDFLKKTYMSYHHGDKAANDPVEFFALISKIYNDFIRSADIILAQPHHQLETVHTVLPGHKIKQTDGRSMRWIERHPENVIRENGHVLVNRALAVNKQVTYNTKENRMVKYMLGSTAKKLASFKASYNKLYREKDDTVIKKIDDMIAGINRRCNTGVLADVTATEGSLGMSLVFSMAPGYRDLYKYYLLLLRGLSITGGIFNISLKDLAVLYEYWCFIKLNSLLRKNEENELQTQDIIKVQNNGIFVSLVKGEASNVEYRNNRTGDRIVLSYNPKETETHTVTQRPDNVLSLTKWRDINDQQEKKQGKQYEYVFDAKYRINPALEGTDYKKNYKNPGPEVDTINTMHRYRDAIIYDGHKSDNSQNPYERTMFGAYVLFPYNDEEKYKNHTFYKSIKEVNIGGLPFLPSATSLVSELLKSLIDESSDSAFERSILPRGIEEKLAKVDWNTRDVLIGNVKNDEQLNEYLHNNYYMLEKMQDEDLPIHIHYIALYQPKTHFGSNAGILYYGKVTKYAKDNSYYRFDISQWNKLQRKINAIGKCIKFTNLFLLKNSSSLPELALKSESEYRLYYELKRAINNTTINDRDENDPISFTVSDDIMVFLDREGKINVSRTQPVFGRDTSYITQTRNDPTPYNISDFIKNPGATFKNIKTYLDGILSQGKKQS